jgi:hypothetical protein
MKLIDIFAKKVMKEKSSFSIGSEEDYGGKNYHFIQDTVGTGRYIYGEYEYKDELFYAKTDIKYKLIAIVVEEIIYIVDDFFLDVWSGFENSQLPANCKKLGEVMCQMNEYIKQVVFKDFYAGLSTQGIEPYSNYKEEARLCLLRGTEPTAESDVEFNLDDAAKCLCNISLLEEETLRRLNEKREQWQKVKATNEKIVEVMKKGNVIKSYELEIAKALQASDAKTVNVEFDINNLRATAKMTPERIIYILNTRGYISEWDFTTRKAGEYIINYLGVSTFKGKNSLRCEHIKKISYGKKVLYEKSNEEE